jgi:hypothetical protein
LRLITRKDTENTSSFGPIRALKKTRARKNGPQDDELCEVIDFSTLEAVPHLGLIAAPESSLE